MGGCDATLKELIETCGTGSRGLTGGGQSGQSIPRQHGRRATNDHRAATFSAETVMCHCQEVCTLLTAQTENNRGRRFFRCPSNNCDFFLWEHPTVSHPNSNNSTNIGNSGAPRRGNLQTNSRENNYSSNFRGGRASRGRRPGSGVAGAFARATGETLANGSCYVCGDNSHWANNCPNRNS